MHKEAKTFTQDNPPTADDILTLAWEHNLNNWQVEVKCRVLPPSNLNFYPMRTHVYDIIFERTIT